MTPLHQDLTALGFSDLSTAGGKTAGLKWIEGGAGLFCGLKVDAGLATWEHEREFRGDTCVTEARAALVLWEVMQNTCKAE